MSNKANATNVKLEKQRQGTPKLRFPEFRGAPAWDEKRLGNIATFFKGKGLPKSAITSNGKSPCIHYGELFTEYSEVIETVKSYTNSKDGVFLSIKNDVLMPTSDVTPSGLAKACCINLDDVILGGDILVIRTSKQEINGEFLARYIRLLEQKVLQLVSGTTVFHLYATSIDKLALSFPSLPEQQKIADCLSSLDQLIAAQNQKLNALSTRKKGLLQKLFPAEGETLPKLRFPEFRDAPEWEERKLGDFSGLVLERAGDNEYTLMSVTAGVGLVTQMEKFGKEIAGKSYKNYFVIRDGDFAYNKSATKDFPEGFVSMLEGRDSAAVPNSIFLCFRIEADDVSPQLLKHMFLANYHGHWLRRFITVGARAHGALNVNPDDLMRMPIRIPAPEEQEKIADCLSSLDDLIAVQDKKLDALKAHKKGLMQQLFPSPEEVQE